MTKGRLVQRFLQGNGTATKDAFQMGILYLINSFTFSQLPDAPINGNEFVMVEYRTDEHFPWGQHAFFKLIFLIEERENQSKAVECYR